MPEVSPPEHVELVVPPGKQGEAVARMVIGGVGDRLDLGFEDVDDLQLAIERLLAEAADDYPVRIDMGMVEQGVRLTVGPLREDVVAEALQSPAPQAGELNLRRVLETVVDSFAVADSVDGSITVTLQKAVKRL